VVHQQELLQQFLECKALALHFFMEWENARTVVVHQQELLQQFLECKALALHIFYGIGKCSYSSGTPPRIATAILGETFDNVLTL